MTKFILFAAAFFGTATLISGQQTIFNVPTIDVLGHGQVYVEFDALFKPNAQAALGRFSSFASLSA